MTNSWLGIYDEVWATPDDPVTMQWSQEVVTLSEGLAVKVTKTELPSFELDSSPIVDMKINAGDMYDSATRDIHLVVVTDEEGYRFEIVFSRAVRDKPLHPGGKRVLVGWSVAYEPSYFPIPDGDRRQWAILLREDNSWPIARSDIIQNWLAVNFDEVAAFIEEQEETWTSEVPEQPAPEQPAPDPEPETVNPTPLVTGCDASGRAHKYTTWKKYSGLSRGWRSCTICGDRQEMDWIEQLPDDHDLYPLWSGPRTAVTIYENRATRAGTWETVPCGSSYFGHDLEHWVDVLAGSPVTVARRRKCRRCDLFELETKGCIASSDPHFWPVFGARADRQCAACGARQYLHEEL